MGVSLRSNERVQDKTKRIQSEYIDTQAFSRLVFPSKGMEWIKPFRDWNRHTSHALFSSSPFDYLLSVHLFELQSGSCIFNVIGWQRFVYALNMNGNRLAYIPSHARATIQFERQGIRFQLKWLDDRSYLVIGRTITHQMLVYVQSYLMDRRDGMVFAWYPTGQIQLCGAFQDDEPTGLWIRWSPSGLYTHLSQQKRRMERSVAPSLTSVDCKQDASSPSVDESMPDADEDKEQHEKANRSSTPAHNSKRVYVDVHGDDEDDFQWWKHYMEVTTTPGRSELPVRTSVASDGSITQYAKWPWNCRLLQLEMNPVSGQPKTLRRWCWYRIQTGLEQVIRYDDQSGSVQSASSYLHTPFHEPCAHGIWRDGEGRATAQYLYGKPIQESMMKFHASMRSLHSTRSIVDGKGTETTRPMG